LSATSASSTCTGRAQTLLQGFKTL